MFSRRKFLRGLAGLLALPSIALARRGLGGVSSGGTTFDYYISPSGSDSNAGTIGSPWAITAINSKQSTYAGKKVGLLDGTYPLYSMLNGGTYANAALVINGSTNSGSPTIIQAVNARKAILDGHSTPGTTGSGYPTGSAPIFGPAQGDSVANRSNLIIDGLVLTGNNTFGISIHGDGTGSPGGGVVSGGAFNGTAYGGPTGIIVRNCEFYDITSNSFGDNPAAINLSFVTGYLVQNCVVHPMLSSCAAEICGMLTFQTNNGVIDSCTFYDCQIGMQEKDGPQGNTTVRYSYFEGYDPSFGVLKSFAAGIPGWTTTIHHCILVGQNPFENADGDNQSQVSQEALQFYNNTLYNGSQFPSFGFLWKSWGSTATNPGSYPTSPAATEAFYNNVINCPGTGAGDIYVNNVAGLAGPIDYNCYRPGTASNQAIEYQVPPGGSTSFYTLSQWQSASSFDLNSIAATPSFVNPGTIDGGKTPAGYQLSGTYGHGGSSPCAGTGKVGGTSGGAATNMGAWDGTVTQIGANFTAGN